MTSAEIETSCRTLSDRGARNCDVILDYYEKLIGRWDFDAASEHLGKYLVQHSPTIADGLAGLEAFVRNVPPPIAAQHDLKTPNNRTIQDGSRPFQERKMGLITTLPPLPHEGVETSGSLLHWAPALAERHTRYATQDLMQAQAHLHDLHKCITLSVPDAESFINYREVLLNIGNLVLTMGCINAQNGYELGFWSGDDYLITIPLQGSGWVSNGDMFVEYGQNDIMIVAPSCSVVKHWDGPGEVISLHVPAKRFDAALVRLGIDRLPITPFMTIGGRRLRSFLRVVDMICGDLQDDSGQSPFTSPRVAEQMEVMLLTLLLERLADNPAAEIATPTESPAIPYYVRRAEDFIAANAHRTIGIEEISAAAGVSLRSIQYGFRRYRDTTPMLYLKRTRYARARAILTSEEGSRRKIADIAAEIGYPNVSQFSRDYRAMFGESPSDTIAAPRRLVA